MNLGRYFLLVTTLLPLAADAVPEDRFIPGTTPADPGTVLWSSASTDARGSMPAGNGDIGLNAWVEASGDVCFYISKTDAWDENLRLLKLNKVRVKLTPALTVGTGFQQELKLRDGAIEFRDNHAMIRLWVDANHPVIQVDVRSLDGQPVAASAALEPWRLTQRNLTGGEEGAIGYTTLPAISYPDITPPHSATGLTWYHRNVVSPWLPSMQLQKLEDIAQTQSDPLLNLTMGGLARGTNWVPESDLKITTAAPTLDTSLGIHLLTKATPTPEAWTAELEQTAAATETIPISQRWQEHCQWWSNFWSRSWIAADGSGAMTLPVNALPWRVGVASNGASRFAGTINDPLAFERALSPTEIATLAATPRSGATTAPTAGNYTNGCTVAAWINPAAGESGRILDKITAGTSDGFLLDAYPGLSLRWIAGTTNMSSPSCLTAGQWQHVAATVDAATSVRRIYLNGTLIKEEVGQPAPALATRGYTLQRWINACSGRGAFPIKFNGSIFVVNNQHDADYRLWGGGYWFQNTRLPYWTMLAAGDFDLMRPLFDMYMKALPARQLATRNYYGHDGAFYPETLSFWGNYLDQGSLGYGTDRTGKPDGLTDNQYIRRHWEGAIELVAMMLDYYDSTRDAAFRDQTLIPFATQIVLFFDQHWPRGTDGKIRMNPAQALETWWDCTNPTPEVSGLRSILPRLLALADNPALKAAWQETLNDLPPVPLSSAAPVRVLPAEIYANNQNSETPELYAVFPFQIYGLGKPDLATGLATYAARSNKRTGGWYQDAIQAACLGLTADASSYVVSNASTYASGFRFPAMWGPNYDWTPDQDHGGVLMNALQRMLVQHANGRILLLPAWPAAWNVSFKLHAPGNTTISGEFRAGKITKLEVTPATRVNEVVLMAAVPLSAGDSATVSAYDVWRMTHYQGDANTDPAIWAPTGDIDGNGITNLMEFATGGDPTAAADKGVVTGGLLEIEGEHALVMTIAAPDGATFAPGSNGTMTATVGGLTYRIEGSANLAAWSRPVEEVTPARDDGLPAPPPASHRYHTFRIASTAPASDRDFIRLRVTVF